MRTQELLLPVVALLLTAAIGCGPAQKKADPNTKPTESAQAPARKKGTIALSVLTMTNPFFKVIADSMTAEAAKHGYDVLVVSGEFDVAKQ
jgi:ribose transport system substrate-binding protein